MAVRKSDFCPGEATEAKVGEEGREGRLRQNQCSQRDGKRVFVAVVSWLQDGGAAGLGARSIRASMKIALTPLDSYSKKNGGRKEKISHHLIQNLPGEDELSFGSTQCHVVPCSSF